MKLRNKKTGETFDFVIKATQDPTASYFILKTGSGGWEDGLTYGTLEELHDEWEDYKPVEPLIKDEKIRKAVRAWAEADDLDNFRVQNEHFNCCKIIGYTAGVNKASFIGFQTTIAHADSKKLYDIAELCGEEKE